MDEIVKYVRLQGYAHLGLAEDGRLTLMMCGPDGVPLSDIERIFFSNIPNTPKPDTKPVEFHPPIKFLGIDLLAQFNKADFDRYQPLWTKIQPNLTWGNALIPDTSNMEHMNPTGPPKP